MIIGDGRHSAAQTSPAFHSSSAEAEHADRLAASQALTERTLSAGEQSAVRPVRGSEGSRARRLGKLPCRFKASGCGDGGGGWCAGGVWA